jgi:hypothetical protein
MSRATMHSLSLVVFCLAFFPVGQACAQQVPLAWPPLARAAGSPLYAHVPHALSPPLADTLAREITPTYWTEGGIVGAVVIGAFSAFFVHEICTKVEGQGENCGGKTLLAFPAGGAFGFLIGALVGGQFAKNPKPAPADSAQVR